MGREYTLRLVQILPSPIPHTEVIVIEKFLAKLKPLTIYYDLIGLQ
jgi:hypothetical protein